MTKNQLKCEIEKIVNEEGQSPDWYIDELVKLFKKKVEQIINTSNINSEEKITNAVQAERLYRKQQPQTLEKLVGGGER